MYESIALDLLVEGQNILGEGVLWCERSGQVYWTDIEGRQLHAYHPESAAQRVWTMPERLCCMAFSADEHVLLLGLASRLAFFHLQTLQLTEICTVEANQPLTRVNDGRCDRAGRFVFGTMDQSAEKSALGSFYRLNTDLQLERLPLPKVAIANSICFSLDGQHMYFCDSMHSVIQRWDGYARGEAGLISEFTALDDDGAAPDGATVDADGCLWSAQWGGGRVVRYAADGRPLCAYTLPVSQPSCVALGGKDRAELFVTTARENLSPAALARQPLAGSLFHTALADTRGVPEVLFAGRLPL